jgi:hypothetical protein
MSVLKYEKVTGAVCIFISLQLIKYPDIEGIVSHFGRRDKSLTIPTSFFGIC